MIWIPESVREGSSLSSYIKDYLVRMGLLASEIDPLSVDALSASLSDYIELSSDRAGFFVEDGNLLLLASQALQSVGEHKAATRMLMLGIGFARPVSWLVTEQESGWTLDVSRITTDSTGGLEIIFFHCLHAALEALAEEWNRYDGEVVLVLRGAGEAGAALLQRPVTSDQVAAFVEEVLMVCRGKLEQLAHQYGWKSTPRLLKTADAQPKRRNGGRRSR